MSSLKYFVAVLALALWAAPAPKPNTEKIK